MIKSKIILYSASGAVEVKEGYQTVKKRLFMIGDFLEVTVKGQKMVLNKSQVLRIENIKAKEKKGNEK